MGHSQTQKPELNKIKTIFTIKDKSRNLAAKSPEEDVNVQNIYSGQVHEMIIIIIIRVIHLHTRMTDY